MARTQTMVQLSDELVTELDAQAVRRGLSRSALIREALDAYLAEQRAADVGQRIVEGYVSQPPGVPDAWGDGTSLGETGTKELLQRLDQEEQRSGHAAW